jgi:hypothetical protein
MTITQDTLLPAAKPPEPESCTDCTAPAEHRGELRTVRVTEGVVRDERVARCTPCHLAYRATAVNAGSIR